METPAILCPCSAVAWEDSKCSSCLNVGNSGVGSDAPCRMVGGLTLPSAFEQLCYGQEGVHFVFKIIGIPKCMLVY